MRMPQPDSLARLLEGCRQRLRRDPRIPRLVYPEGSDERVRAAADRLRAEGLAAPVLLGTPDSPPATKKLAALYYERRRAKGVTQVEAAEIAARPLYQAALMVAAGEADAGVGGAVNTTGETIRAALHAIGPAAGIQTVSSCFAMCTRSDAFGSAGVLLFADGAVVVDPSAAELANIAIASAATFRALTGVEPRVGMLSFSTKGSASHPFAAKVVEAVAIAKARAPGLAIDGELQADAAIVESVAQSKAPGSAVGGRANVLVFPSLDAANISYKLVERLAGAAAIGPLVQGLAKPFHDLSRGCSADDVYAVSLIAALQAKGDL